MAYDTALTIIDQASKELSLGAVSDAFGSTDANIVQLCALLKTCGREVRRKRSWTHLQRSWAFLTTANVGRYALPTDYGRFIPDTQWNRTNRLPVPGALTASEFQALKARLVGPVYNVLFRVLQGNFQAYPDTTTTANWVIAYEYNSKFWVTPSGTHSTSGTWQNALAYSASTYIESGGNIYLTTLGGTSGTKNPTGTSGSISDGGVTDWSYVAAAGADDLTANGDTVNFDSHLMSRALKLSWLKANNFDTAAAQGDYDDALAAAQDDDSAGRTLSVTGASTQEPLLSWRNLPTTGVGS